MMKETELKYTVNTLVDLSRNLWGDNSTEFLAGALQSVITEKQMKTLIDSLEQKLGMATPGLQLDFGNLVLDTVRFSHLTTTKEHENGYGCLRRKAKE